MKSEKEFKAFDFASLYETMRNMGVVRPVNEDAGEFESPTGKSGKNGVDPNKIAEVD